VLLGFRRAVAAPTKKRVCRNIAGKRTSVVRNILTAYLYLRSASQKHRFTVCAFSKLVLGRKTLSVPGK
jgi:hypothetical protein